MFSRILGAPVLLAAAIGLPYLATQSPDLDALLGNKAAPAEEAEKVTEIPAVKQQAPVRPQAPEGPGATLYPTETPLEGYPTYTLQEVINFNVSKAWVYQHWARKSTALSELGLYGIRVPLVTGTQLHDLAGSLTYFFAPNGQLSRISFRGTTGDTTQLVMLVTQQFGLQVQATPVAGQQLYQIRDQQHVYSQLLTRPAPVLWDSSPHDSFSVELDLQHPSVKTPLPSSLPQVTGAPQQRQNPASETAAAESGGEKSAETAKDADPSEKWDAFFPRSRVPKPQVDGLNRRGRMW